MERYVRTQICAEYLGGADWRGYLCLNPISTYYIFSHYL